MHPLILMANIVLVAHLLIVLFVIFLVPLILLGARFGWGFIRNFWLRTLHLALIAFVAGESLIGVFCPLTVWEQELRRRAGAVSYQGSFIEHWVSTLLYWDFPAWVFTVTYVAFALLVITLYRVVPPRSRNSRSQKA